MITIQTLLETLDKTPLENEWNGFYDVESLGGEFGLGGGICYGMDISKDFKELEHKDVTWMCTDTLVGIFFLFLHKEFVGCRLQVARKSDSHYYWKDQETYNKVKKWFMVEFDKQIQQIEPEFIDFEQDMSSFPRK
jgi:hypothetical protein